MTGRLIKQRQYRVKVRRAVEEYLIVLAFDKRDAAARAREKDDDDDENEKVTVLEVVEDG